MVVNNGRSLNLYKEKLSELEDFLTELESTLNEYKEKLKEDPLATGKYHKILAGMFGKMESSSFELTSIRKDVNISPELLERELNLAKKALQLTEYDLSLHKFRDAIKSMYG